MIINDVIYLDDYFFTNDIVPIKRTIGDIEDVDGVSHKTVKKYMPDSNITGLDLTLLLIEEPAYVGHIIYYIQNNIKYGTNYIILKGTDIVNWCKSRDINIDETRVSKGIKRLTTIGVIVRYCESERFKNTDINKKLYEVNAKYIFRGNISKYESAYDNQKDRIYNKEKIKREKPKPIDISNIGRNKKLKLKCSNNGSKSKET